MATALTDQMVADLAPATRTALLEILEGFEQLLGLINQLTEACAALDKLDDLRAEEIKELRLTVRLLCQAQGIDTTGAPLEQLARDYLLHQEASRKVSEQKVYWAEVAQLREQRERLQGGGANA